MQAEIAASLGTLVVYSPRYWKKGSKYVSYLVNDKGVYLRRMWFINSINVEELPLGIILAES